MATPSTPSPSKSELKRELQARQRLWLQEIVNLTRLTPSQIAEQAGTSDSTLTRLLNKDGYQGTLSQLTIDRIKARFRVPGPEDFMAGRQSPVLGFSEAERIELANEPHTISRILKDLIAGRTGTDPWRLKTNALEAVGYLPGDVVLVDKNMASDAKPQDAVCAQVYDWKGGGAETVWRIFTPPFLVAASHDRTAYKPLLVDNDRVVIRGVIVESLRLQRLSAAR